MTIHQYEFQTFPHSTNMDVKLYYCGTEQCARGHTVGPMVREYYKIHYIHSGKGVLCTGGKTYCLSSGQGFLVRPDMLTYYRADEEDPWTYSWVAFNGLQVEYYLKRSHLSQEQPVFETDQDEFIQNCFMDMFKATEQGLNKELRLLGAFYSFLSVILNADSAIKATDNVRGQYVEQAMAIIEQNYANNLQIEQLASKLKLNRKYLSKIFKDTVGVTPQQYSLQYRMNRACELLKNPLLSISEVSSSIGYKDPLLFSRMFKRIMAVSPSQYRKDLKETTGA
ncbi:AraC family transcriptional regulator [Paenibacillus puerhi]|uniref:AraC family transcriptional regulator n=1 Tax=Paenibacillus puerhi TaxID=2692622 RepID=UPI00135A5ABD|nr:AraC family transcriptional regulator [Paenibacillus puerhi]